MTVGCHGTHFPTVEPTEEPTAGPTEGPTEEPTEDPTERPTAAPTHLCTALLVTNSAIVRGEEIFDDLDGLYIKQDTLRAEEAWWSSTEGASQLSLRRGVWTIRNTGCIR